MTMQSKITFPVLNVKMVPIDKVDENGYNPNKVATPELALLERSIREDGFTQPIVCYYIPKIDRYKIVDGYHRFFLARKRLRLKEVPVTVIDKSLAHRMASTIRHNRARGTHSIEGMSNIIEMLIRSGWDESEIALNLGMDKEEVIRLKQNTFLKDIFANHDFSDSWEEFEERYYS